MKVMVEWDPHRPGPGRARLAGYKVPVWAIIQHIHGINGEADPL